MIREHLFDKRAAADPMFRWRGREMSRLEALSDGVFAVTLTLLVVSVDVPGTFYELWVAMRDLPIFLVSFVMLLMAWHYHYMFFRRYGLEDLPTSLLNGAFLFLVMFYAYPLKFLATFLWRLILGDSTRSMFVIPEGVEWGYTAAMQRAGMMYFYGVGVVGVFGVLALMVSWAYRKRDELELDELEIHLTRTSIKAHLVMVGVAALSIGSLLLGAHPAIAGMIYFLIGPCQTIIGTMSAKRAEVLHERLTDGDGARSETD